MSNPASSLPEAWMQSLWTELGANYPGKWQRQFPTPPCPPGISPAQHAQDHIRGIQAVWARRLGHLQTNWKAIRFALDNLPEDPPSLPEFAALCNRRPDPKPQALPAPAPDKAKAAEAIARVREAFARKGDHLDTLRELAESDARDGTYRGRKVTLAQRQTYRQALGMDRAA